MPEPREFRYADIPTDPREPGEGLRALLFSRVGTGRPAPEQDGDGGPSRTPADRDRRPWRQKSEVRTRNRERAFERLREKLIRKLKPRTPRRATKVPRSAKKKRLEAKIRRGRKKELRSRLED